MDEALKSVLEWWDAAGVDLPTIPSGAAPGKISKSVRQQTKPTTKPDIIAPTGSGQNPSKDTRPDATPIAKAAKTLTELKSAMEAFDAGALSDRARQCVFARGNPEADLMIIGEAPGRDEDIAGKPFVGRAGQLLDKMMAAIELTEEQFYITNVVNWRPPQNRNPKPGEIEICRPFLNRHIELVSPKYILIVGGVSLTALTGLTGIMKNRGQWQTLSIAGQDIPALPIYHPAFLLRQPALKKEAWRDLLDLRQKLKQTPS